MAQPSRFASWLAFLFFFGNGIYSYYGIGTGPSSGAPVGTGGACRARRRDDYLASAGSTHRARLAPLRLLFGSGTRQGRHQTVDQIGIDARGSDTGPALTGVIDQGRGSKVGC